MEQSFLDRPQQGFQPTVWLVKAQLSAKDYDGVASICVVHAALHLQLDWLREKSKNKNKEAADPPSKVRDQVCALFAMSSKTYGEIL